MFHDLLVKELAGRHVVAWQGVMDADGEGDAPVTRENVAALMELFPVGDRFYQEFTLKQVLLTAAKNACGPSVAGTSSRAEGRNTAKAAVGKDSPVPEEEAAPTEKAAPTASTIS